MHQDKDYANCICPIMSGPDPIECQTSKCGHWDVIEGVDGQMHQGCTHVLNTHKTANGHYKP